MDDSKELLRIRDERDKQFCLDYGEYPEFYEQMLTISRELREKGHTWADIHYNLSTLISDAIYDLSVEEVLKNSPIPFTAEILTEKEFVINRIKSGIKEEEKELNESLKRGIVYPEVPDKSGFLRCSKTVEKICDEILKEEEEE